VVSGKKLTVQPVARIWRKENQQLPATNVQGKGSLSPDTVGG
jgi:hypothetical protein